MEKHQSIAEQLAHYPGKWVALDRARKKILAIAGTYAEVMEQVEDVDVDDLYVNRAPGIDPDFVPRPFTLLDWESPQVIDDIRTTVPDPDTLYKAVPDLGRTGLVAAEKCRLLWPPGSVRIL